MANPEWQTIQALLDRNLELRAQWQSIAALCRASDFFLPSWTTNQFRSKVFDFFMPAGCLTQAKWPGSSPSKCETSTLTEPSMLAPEACCAPPSMEPPQPVVLEEQIEEAKDDVGILMRAVLDSKSDPAPLNPDGVVLLKLSRMSTSPKMRELFENSPLLETCRRRMAEHGLSIFPDWTEAKLLAPLFPEDCVERGIELQFDHVWALWSDIPAIKAALKTLEGCSSRRPVLKPADPDHKRRRLASPPAPHHASASSAGPMQAEGSEPDSEPESEDELPVLVSVVNTLGLRTNSSVGLPANPYMTP